MHTRKLVASAVAVVTLGTGGLAIAAVNPLAGAGAATPSATTVSTTPVTPTPTTTATHHRHPKLRAYLKAHKGAVVGTAAKAIGIPTSELVSDLKGGQSIAQVAEAHHVPVATVVTALVNQGKAAVAKAEAAGKLTADQAAKLDARLPKAALRLVAAHKR